MSHYLDFLSFGEEIAGDRMHFVGVIQRPNRGILPGILGFHLLRKRWSIPGGKQQAWEAVSSSHWPSQARCVPTKAEI